jgi:phosphomannomutase
MKDKLMTGISGIRGIVGSESGGLTSEIVTRYTSAFGAFRPRGVILIGRDTRPSGKMIREAVVQGLQESGCETIDLGICPTPTLLFNVKDQKTSGGIVITASHNPMEWNGLKFVNKDGLFLNSEEEKALRELVLSNSEIGYPKPVSIKNVVMDKRAIDRHISRITSLKILEVNGLQWRKFKVAVDCCNGAGSSGIPKLLKALGCNVKEINCSPQKPFPRNPEPTVENLTDLSKKVIDEEADLGFAVDPDGDRLSVVTEKGIPLGEEKTLVLIARLILEKLKGIVVTNLSTTKSLEDVVENLGGELVRTPVGEAHVVSKMVETQAILGGEGNGGVIYPGVHLTRDSLAGMALILQLLLVMENPLSSIASSLPDYMMVKKTLPYPREDLERLFPIIQDSYPKGEVDLQDGIRVNNQSSWFHIRASNTEPIVRLICEAKTKQDAETLLTNLTEMISR